MKLYQKPQLIFIVSFLLLFCVHLIKFCPVVLRTGRRVNKNVQCLLNKQPLLSKHHYQHLTVNSIKYLFYDSQCYSNRLNVS